MLLHHIPGLFSQPLEEWAAIRDEGATVQQLYTGFILIVGAIPPVCALIGTTLFGWRIGAGDPVKLTFDSAVQMTIAFYVAILVATYTIGLLIKWMSQTYGGEKPMHVALALAAYTATPLFLVGVMQLYPTLWLNFVVGLPALAYTVYLLYSGLPIMMDIPPERGFLFSTSILAVGLVTLVGLLAMTAALWGIGVGPRFTN